jgi:acyl dehydratase
MRVFRDITALEQAVGTHIGYGDWYAVTQAQINTFADATGDHQWIHVDPERAAGGPFGATIAHGFWSLSLMPKLAAEIYRVDGLALELNYGVNKVRFPAPVLVGSRLRAGIELLSVDRRDTGTQVASRLTIEIANAPKPACVAETLALLVA